MSSFLEELNQRAAEARSPEQRKRSAGLGMIEARRVLNEKGILPPADEAHADMYDPPLTVAETRHRIHVSHGPAIPDLCRFCADDHIVAAALEVEASS